jgi:hypothetical protein
MSKHNVTVCEQHIHWNVVISIMKITRCQNVGVTFTVNSSSSWKQCMARALISELVRQFCKRNYIKTVDYAEQGKCCRLAARVLTRNQCMLQQSYINKTGFTLRMGPYCPVTVETSDNPYSTSTQPEGRHTIQVC